MSATTPAVRKMGGARVVAAIMHDTRRVLTVQLKGDSEWRPPSGDLGQDESAVGAARRHVRHATGFEILASGTVDRYDLDGHSLLIVRCKVSGVGSDIAPEVRAMRWMTRSDVLAQPRCEWTDGLLAALGSDSGSSGTAASDLGRIALAG